MPGKEGAAEEINIQSLWHLNNYSPLLPLNSCRYLPLVQFNWKPGGKRGVQLMQSLETSLLGKEWKREDLEGQTKSISEIEDPDF